MFKKIILVLVLPVFLVVFGVQPAAFADDNDTCDDGSVVDGILTVNCANHPVAFGDPGDCDYQPNVTIEFSIAGSVLTATLTHNGPTAGFSSRNHILTGLLFNVTDQDLVMEATNADIDADSLVSPKNFLNVTDVKGQWAAKGRRIHSKFDKIVGGIDAGDLGLFDNAVASTGDINALGGGTTTLGDGDLIGASIGALEVFQPQPGGADFGIIPLGLAPLLPNPLVGDGPYVEGQVTITYDIESLVAANLSLGEITDVTPLFGTDGLPTADYCGDPSEGTVADPDGGINTNNAGGNGKGKGLGRNK